MINNSLIKVKVQEYTSPAKHQQRLFYKRMKPYMQAYGLSPEFFEFKGKSIVLKNNNPNNQSYLNRSEMSVKSSNKTSNQKISNHRPQAASLQLPNNVDLPISNKYANLFNEMKNAENKLQFQYYQRVDKSFILKETDETSEQSYIRKHDLKQKNIAQLEKVKKVKIQELEILQKQIAEARNADINAQYFIIKKSVHKSTIREKKDKAASLIQAYVKGRIQQKRYISEKKRKEQKLSKVIFIQQWWKLQMKNLKIQKQFQITHKSKQMRLIDGHTFFIITNYSYILYRIRLKCIEKMGIKRGDFRFYLNQQNCLNVLSENISKESFEFLTLMNLIINNLIKIIQIQDDHLILDFQNQNIINIPHLMLQVYLKINYITANQYQLLILNQEEIQQFEQITQETNIVQIENQQNIQNDQDISMQNNLVEQQVYKQNIQLSTKNIEELQSSETNENINQQQFYEENKNEIVENQDENQTILNRSINMNNNQSIDNIQDKELIAQKIQEQTIQQNEQINLDYQKYNQINQTIKNQYQDQDLNIQQNQIIIQDHQNQLILNQESHQQNVQNNNIEIQQINQNSLQQSNNVELCQLTTQIIQNDILSSQKLVDFDKQTDQEEMQINKEDIIKQDQQIITQQYTQQNSQISQEQEIIMNNYRVVEDKREEFEQVDNKVNKPFEIQQIEEDQKEQILKSEYIKNINILSQNIEKEPSQQNFKKKDNDQQPLQIDFHNLKSCDSNIFILPNSGKETAKHLNSGELLDRTNFIVQLGQLEKFENENNSLLGSCDLKKEVEGLPEPVNLRNNNNNQQEQFLESQSFLRRIPSDFSGTFKFQFSQEFKTFQSGQLISQQFDIKIQQQDSLEYSIDESQDLQPIYITTIKVDDINVDIFQIKDILRLKDKNEFYQSFDFKITTIQQSNQEYIIQNLYVYIIKNCINCIEGNQILRIQKYLKRFRFVQSCVLNINKESTLFCLFKSCFKIKLSIYGQFEEEIIIEKMTIKQRKILDKNFYSICPLLLLSSQMGLKQMILEIIKVCDFQSE